MILPLVDHKLLVCGQANCCGGDHYMILLLVNHKLLVCGQANCCYMILLLVDHKLWRWASAKWLALPWVCVPASLITQDLIIWVSFVCYYYRVLLLVSYNVLIWVLNPKWNSYVTRIYTADILIYIHIMTCLIINTEQPLCPGFKFYVWPSPVSSVGGVF